MVSCASVLWVTGSTHVVLIRRQGHHLSRGSKWLPQAVWREERKSAAGMNLRTGIGKSKEQVGKGEEEHAQVGTAYYLLKDESEDEDTQVRSGLSDLRRTIRAFPPSGGAHRAVAV